MTSTVIAQANLKKKDDCNVELYDYIRDKVIEYRTVLIGIHEPGCGPDKMISTLPDRNLIYHRSDKERPRAALFVSNGNNVVPSSTYTDRDMATGLWITKDEKLPFLMVTSVYMDKLFKPVVPYMLSNLMKYCKRQGL